MKQRPKLAKQRVFAACVALVVACAAFAPAAPKLVVVLDAGHGGKDPGNLGTGRYIQTEKDVTLDVTLQVGSYIEENLPEVKVLYTRKDDSFPALRDRVRMANEAQADLFISIHCDAFDGPGPKGSSTYVMGMHKSEESFAWPCEKTHPCSRKKATNRTTMDSTPTTQTRTSRCRCGKT